MKSKWYLGDKDDLGKVMGPLLFCNFVQHKMVVIVP